MNWIELGAAAAAGGVAGWLAHAWARARSPTRRETDRPIGVASSRRSVPGTTSRPAPPVVAAAPRMSDGATAAGRVIAHLYALGRLGEDEVASPGFTQRGMGEKLGLRQGTLAKVLDRLATTGVVTSDRRHVTGEPRRLNVYRLTPLGDSIARELNRRRVVPGPTETRSPPIPRVTIELDPGGTPRAPDPGAPAGEVVGSR